MIVVVAGMVAGSRTATGEGQGSVEQPPSPSCPVALRPKPYTEPCAVSTSVCPAPQATCTQPSHDRHMTVT